MLQEDWTHRIVSHLALYSCYMYLKNPVPWTDPSEAEKPEDDGEEVCFVDLLILLLFLL